MFNLKFLWFLCSVALRQNLSPKIFRFPDQPSKPVMFVASKAQAPFVSLTICCSNITHEEKLRMETIVLKLGGVYSPSLDTGTVTHLIIPSKDGEKYNEAVQHDHIQILKPEWVLACGKQNKLVDPATFNLFYKSPNSNDLTNLSSQSQSDNDNPPQAHPPTPTPSSPPLLPPPEISPLFSITYDTHRTEIDSIKPSSLFIACKFYFINLSVDTPRGHNAARLIRLGGGTRFWDLDESVTILVTPR